MIMLWFFQGDFFKIDGIECVFVGLDFCIEINVVLLEEVRSWGVFLEKIIYLVFLMFDFVFLYFDLIVFKEKGDQGCV